MATTIYRVRRSTDNRWAGNLEIEYNFKVEGFIGNYTPRAFGDLPPEISRDWIKFRATVEGKIFPSYPTVEEAWAKANDYFDTVLLNLDEDPDGDI